MKAILASIKPQHLIHILRGDKTVEPRTSKSLASAVKKLIQQYGYATIYLYCSKNKPYLNKIIEYDYDSMTYYEPRYGLDHDNTDFLNGKIVCSFKCYEIEEIRTDYAPRNSFFDESCMTPTELFDYIGHSMWFALHISDLKIFDEPKDLYEFKTPNKYKQYQKDLKNAYKTDQKIIDKRYYGLTDDIPNSVELTELSEPYYGLFKAPRNFIYIETAGGTH